MQVNNTRHCGWGGAARRPAEVPGVPVVALGEGAGGGCMTFQRVGGRGCCRGARRPIGSFAVPDLALGEGAGGGCMTFQRVGGRGCCRGARRPIGSFGVPDLAAGEGAGGGCMTFQRVGGRGCCRGARRPIGSLGGAGRSARRGCWWRLQGSFGPGDDAGDLAGFVPVEVDEVAELMSVGLPFRARVASRRSSRMRRWWPRRRRGRYRPGLSVMRV